jgi:hypothetical protein
VSDATFQTSTPIPAGRNVAGGKARISMIFPARGFSSEAWPRRLIHNRFFLLKHSHFTFRKIAHAPPGSRRCLSESSARRTGRQDNRPD